MTQQPATDPELFLVARVEESLVATVVGGYDGVRDATQSARPHSTVSHAEPFTDPASVPSSL